MLSDKRTQGGRIPMCTDIFHNYCHRYTVVHREKIYLLALREEEKKKKKNTHKVDTRAREINIHVIKVQRR